MIDATALALALLFVGVVPYIGAAALVCAVSILVAVLLWFWQEREARMRRIEANAAEANSTARALGDRVARLEKGSRCAYTEETDIIQGHPVTLRCVLENGHHGRHVCAGGK